jgi:hypothetical protein
MGLSRNDHATLAQERLSVHNAHMTTRDSHDGAPGGPLAWDGGSPDATERELRAKARALQAVAQSALATSPVDGTIREYLNAVMAFAGMYVGE